MSTRPLMIGPEARAGPSPPHVSLSIAFQGRDYEMQRHQSRHRHAGIHGPPGKSCSSDVRTCKTVSSQSHCRDCFMWPAGRPGPPFVRAILIHSLRTSGTVLQTDLVRSWSSTERLHTAATVRAWSSTAPPRDQDVSKIFPQYVPQPCIIYGTCAVCNQSALYTYTLSGMRELDRHVSQKSCMHGPVLPRGQDASEIFLQDPVHITRYCTVFD